MSPLSFGRRLKLTLLKLSLFKRGMAEDCCKTVCIDNWDKVFKNGQSKICGRQPSKNLNWYGLPNRWSDHITSNFLKAVFHKFYLVHSFEYFVPNIWLWEWDFVQSEVIFTRRCPGSSLNKYKMVLLNNRTKICLFPILNISNTI